MYNMCMIYYVQYMYNICIIYVYGIIWEYQYIYIYLVGGLEHLDYVFHILEIIIPTDELHHFSDGLAQPPIR